MLRCLPGIGIIFAFLAISGCNPYAPKSASFVVGAYTVTVDGPRNQVPNDETLQRISQELSSRLAMLDPATGEVLGRLNDSEPGEIIPAGPVSTTLEEVLSCTTNCFGAFDPTLQILWDVYDFADGGRYVSDQELADAIRWVDFRQVEMDRDGILRKTENTRMGLGPTLPGAVADWSKAALGGGGMVSGRVQVGQCVVLWGAQTQDYVYDVKYPLDQIAKDETQLTIGHLKLKPGESLAAIDDDEGFFFAHGERYHRVLNPLDGRPEGSVRAAVVVCEESCLQAAIYAYALMVMGLDRGMQFLDETDGVEGLILTEDHQLHASGGLSDRFWR
jgi:thiamine biosynthesis lipoprotein ApbE